MFGISNLGWVHTIGSLPAIPAAIYMFMVYERIMPRTKAGLIYLISMVIGTAMVFVIAHQPVSYIIGMVTFVLLFLGYVIGLFPKLGRITVYLETIFLTLTVFLLALPTISETLRRVPDGNPIVKDMHDPLLIGVQLGLLVILIIGLTTQIIMLRKHSKNI